MGLVNEKVKVVGFDVFIVHQGGVPSVPQEIGSLKLSIISNRGTKVWPGATPSIHLTDVHRCRFISKSNSQSQWTPISAKEIITSLEQIESSGFEWVHVEKLIQINGEIGFSKAQGE